MRRRELGPLAKTRALNSQVTGASRNSAICDDNRMFAYYARTLAFSFVAVENATGRSRRNMPDPIPVVVL